MRGVEREKSRRADSGMANTSKKRIWINNQDMMCGYLVHDDDSRLAEESSGDAQKLPLSDREVAPVLEHY